MNIQAAINLAKSQVGTLEGKNQRVKYNDEYWRVGRYSSWAHWCAAFIWWVFKHSDNLGALNNVKSASVNSYWQQLKTREVKRHADICPGDIMFIWYRDSIPHHIGLVIDKDDHYFYTIEGNTSAQGSSGSERNGEGVYKKRHVLGAKCRVARPYWEEDTSVFPLSSGWVFAKGGPQSYSGHTGAYREHIRHMQRRLQELGYSLEADGLVGSQTESVILAFQQSRGLDTDGKVGAKTWEALFGGGSFKEDEGGLWYEREDKSYPKGEWECIGGSWYLFDGQGYAYRNCTAWVDGKLYAFTSTGACIIGKGSIETDSSGAIVSISR